MHTIEETISERSLLMLAETLHIPAHYSFYIKLAGSLCIILFFIIMRKFMHKFILGFFKKTPTKLSDLFEDISQALDKPLDYLLLITGAFVAILASPFVSFPKLTQPNLILGELQFSLDFISSQFLSQSFGTLFIIGLTWGTYNFIDVYEKLLLRMGSKFTLLDNAIIIRFSSKLIKLAIMIIGVGLIVSLHTDLGNLLTGVGIAGAAFTFIAKDALMDIMSGIVLMVDTPFTIGDWVVAGGIEGTIEDISFRSTRIRTFEQGLVVVPNATLANDNILNWSKMPKRRYRFSFGVSYATSSDTLKAFIESIKEQLGSMESIETDTLLVYFDNFGDHSLNIIIQYFTTQTDIKGYTGLKEEVNLALMNLAKAYDIEIAFPTQTLFLHNETNKPE